MERLRAGLSRKSSDGADKVLLSSSVMGTRPHRRVLRSCMGYRNGGDGLPACCATPRSCSRARSPPQVAGLGCVSNRNERR